jgi:H+/Cl- antiporter ClcA
MKSARFYIVMLVISIIATLTSIIVGAIVLAMLYDPKINFIPYFLLFISLCASFVTGCYGVWFFNEQLEKTYDD